MAYKEKHNCNCNSKNEANEANDTINNENLDLEKESNTEDETLENPVFEENKESENINETEKESLDEKVDKLTDENKLLNNQLDAMKDKYVRVVAEYDNYRKRTSKEKENIYSDSCADVLKQLLPVLDNLERAVASNGEVEELRQGIEMTLKQFNTALEKLVVEEIPTDAEFNPNIHNAVMHIEDDSFDKNQIAEVFQKGYKRGDKILRCSTVKVAN